MRMKTHCEPGQPHDEPPAQTPGSLEQEGATGKSRASGTSVLGRSFRKSVFCQGVEKIPELSGVLGPAGHWREQKRGVEEGSSQHGKVEAKGTLVAKTSTRPEPLKLCT